MYGPRDKVREVRTPYEATDRPLQWQAMQYLLRNPLAQDPQVARDLALNPRTVRYARRRLGHKPCAAPLPCPTCRRREVWQSRWHGTWHCLRCSPSSLDHVRQLILCTGPSYRLIPVNIDSDDIPPPPSSPRDSRGGGRRG